MNRFPRQLVVVLAANVVALLLAGLLPGIRFTTTPATLLVASLACALVNAPAQEIADRFFSMWLSVAQFDPRRRGQMATALLARLLFVPLALSYWLRNGLLLHYAAPLLPGAEVAQPVSAVIGGLLLNLANWERIRHAFVAPAWPGPRRSQGDPAPGGSPAPTARPDSATVDGPEASVASLFEALLEPRQHVRILKGPDTIELRAGLVTQEEAGDDQFRTIGHLSAAWPGAREWREVRALLCALARVAGRAGASSEEAERVTGLQEMRFRLTGERLDWNRERRGASVEIDVLAEGSLAEVAEQLAEETGAGPAVERSMSRSSPVQRWPSQKRLEPGARFGPFRIESVIGSSSLASDFRAEQIEDGRHVALQVLTGWQVGSPERLRALEGFLRQAERLARLDHPSVQRALAAGHDEDLLWLSRVPLPRETLDVLSGSGSPTPEVAALLLPVADLLDLAHESGLVHGALASGHVRVTASGAPIVTGFDAEWLLRSRGLGDRPVAQLAHANIMSPEQVQGHPVSPAADVFCLASLAAELITGTALFRDDNVAAALFGILRGPETVRATGLPGALLRVLERGLAPEPRDRWPSCRALVEALREAESPD